MSQNQVAKIKELKEKFKEMPAKEREKTGICFLKVKLGVHHPEEFEVVIKFLDDFDMDITPENLDAMMNYLHSTSQKLPEFIALEDSLTDIKQDSKKTGLSDYNADEAETLKEGVKPFR